MILIIWKKSFYHPLKGNNNKKKVFVVLIFFTAKFSHLHIQKFWKQMFSPKIRDQRVTKCFSKKKSIKKQQNPSVFVSFSLQKGGG